MVRTLQCPWRILSIIGQNHSLSNSKHLHVEIFRFFLINLMYILNNLLNWWVVFLKSWTWNWLFLDLNQFICNYTVQVANWASSDDVLFHKLRRSIYHFTYETESPWPVHFKHSLVEKAELVQVQFTPHLRDQQSMWMQDGCKVYMDSYMASNGSCFMVTWIIFKNHLLEVGPTQNHKTTAHWTLPTIDLFNFITHEDTHE